MAADVADLNPDFAARLMAMVRASGGQLSINSGYRSVAEQTALWNADPNPQRVAYPGTSMHNKGLAADLGGNVAWAHAHAGEFGLYFPMPWEPWHVQPIGVGSGGDAHAQGLSQGTRLAPPQQNNTLAHGLDVIGQSVSGAPGGQAPTVTNSLDTTAGQAPTTAGSAPTAEDPLLQGSSSQQQPQQRGMPSAPGQPPSGGGGALFDQLRAGFNRAGRPDLAAMVGTPAFNAWTNAESSGNPSEVSPANNQGKPNGGLFQFWAGHGWAQPFFQGGRFTMSPEEQAYMAATQFNLTPQKIKGYADQIAAGHYVGWG